MQEMIHKTERKVYTNPGAYTSLATYLRTVVPNNYWSTEGTVLQVSFLEPRILK